MSTTIRANVSRMFRETEPYLVSGSVAELGNDAGKITWRNALAIAKRRAEWLESDEKEACAGMRDWAHDTGAWDEEETAKWSPEECLALFVQNVASELRMLGSDDDDLASCLTRYETTDWDREPEYPIGSYYSTTDDDVRVEFYTGC